jgi:chromosome segregation ATPase
MTRRRTLVPGQDNSVQEALDDTATGAEETYETSEEEVYEEQYWEEEPARPRGTWIVPTLTALAALGWTAFFGWVHWQEILAGAPPAQWVDWIVQWSVPLVLLVALYLLAMRNSRREANRFSEAAHLLSRESAQLESRLKVVNRELALARNFIESQSQDLETLGRLASERLATHADRLQDLIRHNSAQVETIGHVSESAVANMETLRDQLPVLANSARDMNNQMGSAGNSAKEQVNALVAAFERLNSFGEAGEAHVVQINEKVQATLASFEEQIAALGDLAGQRFERLRTSSDDFRRELETAEERVFDAISSRSEALSRQLHDDAEAMREREAEAASAMRERLVALRVEGERLVDSLGSGQASATQHWSDAITALEERMKQMLEGLIKLDESAMTNARMRLVALNNEASKVDERLSDSMAAFEADFARRREADEARQREALARLEEQIAQFDQRMAERQEDHLAHVAGLAERGEALASRLNTLDGEMQQLGSQADETSGRLAQAADALADRLSQSRAVLEESGTFLGRLTDDSVRLLELIRSSADHSEGALSDAVSVAERRLSTFGETARELHDLIKDAESRGSSLAEQLDTTREAGTASLEQLGELKTRLDSVSSETEKLAQRTTQELREAIEALSAASASVLENLRGEQTQAVQDLAQQVAEASREQLAEAMRRHAEETITELEQATARADDAGRETATLLREQLARVNELAANLETRVEYAREKAEEQVDNDFARRTALITEALNSSAIDIAKAFDNDIGDTQWTHYLRGDRGIFTRRAVRLLDKHDARQVSAVYSEDAEFREVVNRYIHDFEAMLRGILSTRDGNAMAVTLLSSDMGKLYVALAQAIDRLRD